MVQTKNTQIIAQAAIDEITQGMAEQGLESAFISTVERWYAPLAQDIATLAKPHKGCFFLGIQGCQGSGKSTLTSFLKTLLEKQHGLKVAALSLDDFYLTKESRQQLAASVHPLLITRGVPGTHDLPLAERIFKQLAQLNKGETLALPMFEKARDDRAPVERWPLITGPVDLVIFEGWCVGASAQKPEELDVAVNSLEADEDPNCIWRKYVNKQLEEPYAELFSRLDKLLVLNAPSFDCVYAWRSLQEQKLAQKVREHQLQNTNILNANGLLRFISHYERLTRHCLDSLPHKADWLLPLDNEHQITDLIRK